MSEISVRTTNRAGHITLQRPQALNAVTYEMVKAIDAALIDWWDNPKIDLLVIDAVGEKAFSAGGDLGQMYATGMAGDYGYGRKFWRDEYTMNARLFRFPRPVVSFLQGFTMGGGVGVGCHGSHRIVGDTSRIAMPEAGVGLVPDVGGSLLLANAPGRLGEYLATTAARMGPADAIYAGFADYYLPEAIWPDLRDTLLAAADHEAVDRAAGSPPDAELMRLQPEIDRHFAGETLDDILRSLRHEDTPFTRDCLKRMEKNSPLSMACAVEMMHRLGEVEDIERALELEYRFTSRAMAHGDFLEGIRAAIIDKDRSPKWSHSLDDLPRLAVTRMLMPLGPEALKIGEAS